MNEVYHSTVTTGRSAGLSLKPVEVVSHISPEDFKQNYFKKNIPVIIKDLSRDWPAYNKWNWDYFKQVVGNKQVGIYNNVKSDAYSPVNKADDYTTFGNYIDMISHGDSEWRIFLFNIFRHAPQTLSDFTWPVHLMKGFVKRVPMLFVGGKGSITHMHFDMDLSHVLHTQFAGKKHVLLYPYEEQYKLYRKPFEVLSLVDFSYYHDERKSKVDLKKFPALKYAQGFSATLDHGDTLFMPAGYWHHMEYEDSGFAMSLRAVQGSMNGKLHALWKLLGMRNIDTLLKKTAPMPWYQWKERKIAEYANNALAVARGNAKASSLESKALNDFSQGTYPGH